MYAVIESCGKQYKVAEGDVVFFEKLDAEEGKKVTFDKVKYPYVANCTAEYVDENTSSGYIKELLSKQVYSSVRFEQSVRKMIADGYDTFVEVGPGKTLSGFVKKIAKSMEKEVVIK